MLVSSIRLQTHVSQRNTGQQEYMMLNAAPFGKSDLKPALTDHLKINLRHTCHHFAFYHLPKCPQVSSRCDEPFLLRIQSFILDFSSYQEQKNISTTLAILK